MTVSQTDPFVWVMIIGYSIVIPLVLIGYPILAAYRVKHDLDDGGDFFGWTLFPALALLVAWWIVIPLALIAAFVFLVYWLAEKFFDRAD